MGTIRLTGTVTNDDSSTSTFDTTAQLVAGSKPPIEPPIEPPPSGDSVYPDGSAQAPGDTGNALYTFFAGSSIIGKYHSSNVGNGRVFGTDGTKYGPANANVRQPPWKVAGVDYPVGIRPEYLPLKKPTAGNLPSGATLSGKQININKDNVTIQGFDFSGMNIWLPNPAIKGVVISDCYCKMDDGNKVSCIDGNNGGISIKYCAIDGNNISTANATTINRTWEHYYCYLVNAQQDLFNYGGGQPGLAMDKQGCIVKFCAIVDPGVGGGHADWYQAGGAGAAYPWNTVAEFCFFWQRGAGSPSPWKSQGTQGWIIAGWDNPGVCGGFNNNMVISARNLDGGTPISKVLAVYNDGKGSHVVDPGVRGQWNYIDPTGASPVINYVGSQSDTKVKISNNMDVTTGKWDGDAGFAHVP